MQRTVHTARQGRVAGRGWLGSSAVTGLLRQAHTPLGSAQLIEDAALVAEAAAKKHEDNRCGLVDSGCASQLVEGLWTQEVSQSCSAVQGVTVVTVTSSFFSSLPLVQSLSQQ